VLDPIRLLRARLLTLGLEERELQEMEKDAIRCRCGSNSRRPLHPRARSVHRADHVFCPPPGNGRKRCAFPRVEEVPMGMPPCLPSVRSCSPSGSPLYGQDVGRRLGRRLPRGATLASSSGITGIQAREAYIIGRRRMSAVGARPMWRCSSDYNLSGLQSAVRETSKSCYLAAGKFPVNLDPGAGRAYGGGRALS